MNAHNEQHVIEQIAQQWDGCMYDSVGEAINIGEAIRAAGKRLSSQPAAAQEAVGWQFWHEMPGGCGEWRNGSPDHVVKNHRRNTEAAGIPTRNVYAAPVTAATAVTDPVAAYERELAAGATHEHSLHAICTPAAPGIDAEVRRLVNAAKQYAQPMPNETQCLVISMAVAAAVIQEAVEAGARIDASPKGATLNEQFGSAEGLDGPKGAALTFEVPAGWALVPDRMQLTPENMELLADTLRGADEAEPWCGGVLWVGQTTDDDGEPTYYGLNVGNVECLEEGSINIVEFAEVRR